MLDTAQRTELESDPWATEQAAEQLAVMLDPALLMQATGLEPVPWQAEVLRSTDPRLLLLCARQSGKSEVTACLALHTAIYQADSLVLLLSPTQRQSGLLFQKIITSYVALGRPSFGGAETSTTLPLSNGSQIVSLPGSPETIRGYSKPRLIVIDEAAWTEDALFVACNPMLAVSRPPGRLVCLSTPFGKRGWFYYYSALYSLLLRRQSARSLRRV